MDEPGPEEAAYLRAVLAASALGAEALDEMERVAERLAPERSQALARALEERFGSALDAAEQALEAAPAPETFAPFDAIFRTAFGHTAECLRLFAGFPRAPAAERIPRILAALHHHAQAQEHFYALHPLLPPFAHYWSAGGSHAGRPAAPTAARSPLVRVSAGGHHGGFSLYVPEAYDERDAWPLIVALHGGSGNGRDFLWTWVREARGRGYLLVAPTASASTWSERDDGGLLEILGWLRQRYHLAPHRVLLTGLSDGATFCLLYGLAHPDVYDALAPCCGVLHPLNLSNGNLERARGVPVYLVHGAQDFLFPVTYARFTRETLVAAGADVTYRELPELSHTYPRSENPAILDWFVRVTSTP